MLNNSILTDSRLSFTSVATGIAALILIEVRTLDVASIQVTENSAPNQELSKSKLVIMLVYIQSNFCI